MTVETTSVEEQIAIRLFGWPKSGARLPHFLTNLEDTFRVVETMRERGWKFGLDEGQDSWIAAFYMADEDGLIEGSWHTGESLALPWAICRAAFAALEAETAPK